MISNIITIDGNIGSGKSTLYNKLQYHYRNNNDICFVPEPVDEWKNIVDNNNTPILTNLYKDTKKYAFRFQMMAYISRLNLLRNARKQKYKLIISERCVQTDRNVFAKMLYDGGNIEHDEYLIYNKWFDEFLDELNIAGIIYIKADPEICEDRVKKRGRAGEIIPLKYLQKCHEYHEEWLNKENNKLVINANVDITSNIRVQNNWIKAIDNWIKMVLNIDIMLEESVVYPKQPDYIPDGLIWKTNSDTTESNNESKYKYVLQFDGGCRGNPSNKLGLGCVLLENNTIIDEQFKLVFVNDGTNNKAEYMALIMGLKLCINNKVEEVLVQGDSELIIKQINKIYKVSSANLLPYYNEVFEYNSHFKKIKFEHVKRHLNKIADSLANKALDSNM
jgi:deoxyadenosine/deoxycytidine kinase/ribonuclease HI